MAHTPSITGGRVGSVAVDKSECDPFGEGVVDLVVKREFERGEIGEPGSGDLNNDMRDRELLSGCMGVEPLTELSWLWLFACE